MKKIFVGLLTLGAALVVIPMFAAFEAHVINVTARIENALSVTTKDIDFGTVFPQEHLDQPLEVALSSSFLTEDRVDDVEYIIRQKPKCGWTLDDGKNLLGLPTATGHVDDQGNVTCPDPGNPLRPQGAVWGPLPSLCEYISKESQDENDSDLASFHKPWAIATGDNPFTEGVETDVFGLVWNDVNGYLAKSVRDTTDDWTIDLTVPCFGGYCAQDWADFVHGINPQADPAQYTQPIENEHKVFGCDLWVEVAGVSETRNTD